MLIATPLAAGLAGLVPAIPLLTTPNAPPPEVMRISAELPANLQVGEPAELTLTVEIDEAWSSSSAGIPKPILQIDVPPSIELTGKVLRTSQELARNEFLSAPFERLVETGTTTIGLTLKSTPGPQERLGLNVIAYVARGEDDAWFVRRRVELTPRAGASQQSATDSDRSNWTGGDGLQIGDTAPDFELPRADGSTVKLSDLLARGNVVVTTYRAFW